MNKKEFDYLQYISMLDLTTYHYKILLQLIVRTQNQTQLVETLNIQKQNVYKYIKELEALNLVEIDRIEGRNKFYKAVIDLEKIVTLIPGQTKLL